MGKSAEPSTILSSALRSQDIPFDDAQEEDLHRFALTFDGYSEFPDSSREEDTCAGIARNQDHSTLRRARACLFFEQRRSRQSEFGWDRPYILLLLQKIRDFVSVMEEARGRSSYRFPKVNNKHGATTADILAETIALCEANIETINRVAHFRRAREVRDEINRRLRGCHNWLGMAAGSRRFGCLYREVDLDENEPMVVEHAIPVTALVDMYESGTPFIDLVFLPVALISKVSDGRLNDRKLTKTGHDAVHLLRRYATADISLETHYGERIDASSWTRGDHNELIARTPELSMVREEVVQLLARDAER